MSGTKGQLDVGALGFGWLAEGKGVGGRWANSVASVPGAFVGSLEPESFCKWRLSNDDKGDFAASSSQQAVTSSRYLTGHLPEVELLVCPEG